MSLDLESLIQFLMFLRSHVLCLGVGVVLAPALACVRRRELVLVGGVVLVVVLLDLCLVCVAVLLAVVGSLFVAEVWLVLVERRVELVAPVLLSRPQLVRVGTRVPFEELGLDVVPPNVGEVDIHVRCGTPQCHPPMNTETRFEVLLCRPDVKFVIDVAEQFVNLAFAVVFHHF